MKIRKFVLCLVAFIGGVLARDNRLTSQISGRAIWGQAVAQSKRDETLWLHLPSGGCQWLFPPHRGVRERH